MSNIYDRCPNCMNPYDGSGEPCPYCGQDVMGYTTPKNCLPPFTILQGKYMIGRVLGQGGFGITYIGYDMNLATYVAVKEYYPESISSRGLADNELLVTSQAGKEEIYNKNLNRFVEEARNLSKFYSLPGIVSVRNFFYENGTAYIVMDYVAGSNLKKYLADNGGKLDEATILTLMKPVLESLYEIHKQGLIHRDISPDNIMFDDDGTIKLIDFGAVRGTSADMDMTYTVMLKHGYAPQEQYYTKGNQGPWTDIYSLCATMYKMLTGNVPPNCIERMSEDSYVPPSWCGVQVSPQVEQALAKGLAVNIADRYQNIGELIKDLYGKDYTFMEDGQLGMTQQIKAVDADEPKKSNKKILAIIVSSLAAVALLAVCLKVFVLGKGEDKVTTEATTETVVETATDAASEETTEATTEEVIKLEGAWTDFKFMIDDDLHQLPMTYDEWTAHGWVADTPNTTVQPGETVGVKFHNDKIYCSTSMVNYSTEPVGYEDCYVIGFFYSHDYFSTEEQCDIILPGDVTVSAKNYKKSMPIETAMEIYGEPSYKSLGEFISLVQYSADDGSYLTFYGGENGAIYCVEYCCYEEPEGAQLIVGSTPEKIPSNEIYEAPGATTDRFDDIFCIDGVNYKLWCPLSQFVANGWTVECEKDMLDPGFAATVILRKGDASIEVKTGNTTIFKLPIEESMVMELILNVESCAGVSVIMPGGVRLGDDSTKIATLYSDLDVYKEYDLDEKFSQSINEYGVCDGSIYIYVSSIKSETEEGVYYMTEYTYERSYSASRADLENVDYIQGITVNQ